MTCKAKMNRSIPGRSKSLSLSPSLGQSINNQVRSIVDDLNTCFEFHNLEDLHTTLLSAAQAEHAKVREKAHRLLELEQIRHERDSLKRVAEVAEERVRVKIQKEIDARRILDAEVKVKNALKRSPSSKVQSKPPETPKSKSIGSVKPKSTGTYKSKLAESIKPNSGEKIKSKLPGTLTSSPPESNKAKRVEATKFKSAENVKIEPVQSSKPAPVRITELKSLGTPKLEPKDVFRHTFTPPTQPKATSTQARSAPRLLPSSSVLPNDSTGIPAKPSPPFDQPVIKPSHSAPNATVPPIQQLSLNSNSLNTSFTDPKAISTSGGSNLQDADIDAQYHGAAKIARYREIHAQMKLVRKQVENQVDGDGNPTEYRAACNRARREITKSLGQLVVGNKNLAIAEKVSRQLIDALRDKTQFIPLSSITVESPELVTTIPSAANNIGITEDQAPLAFIYLLVSFCKAICAQLVSEAALKPRAASPIGILAVKIFSRPELLWRGKSLIDVLISKMFVVCPVLFGIRGDESTPEGRARIGWRKLNGKFISEQAHFDRMTGIAAGYAAISLRDFSRTVLTNPYPPTNYWLSLSAIVNTPNEQTFSTQFVVLKGLIEQYFSRFIHFYGDMAVAALQAALVEFPKRAAAANAAVGTLKTLGLTLQKDHGLTL